LPQVFESGISAADLQKLKLIIESEDFRALTGIVGDPYAYLSWRLVVGLSSVIPHANVDIFETSVRHPNGNQMLTVFGGMNNPDFKSFVQWVDEVGKRKVGRLGTAAANQCATSSSPGTVSPWEHTTQAAKPVYKPDPEYPINGENAKHEGTVLVHVIVNADGSVASVSVKHGLDPVLDQKALDAVRGWKFSPALLDGMVIPFSTDMEVHFRSQ